jgi:hypothetical protein
LYKNTVAGMILIWVVLFPWTSPGAAEAKNCQLKRYASLDLTVVLGSYLLVPVTMQGTRAYMVLNMATPFSNVTESAVSTLALKTKPVPGSVAVHESGKQVKRLATAASFSLGQVQFKNADFLVLPNESFSSSLADAPIVGFLGMDVFGQVDIELDVAHRKMNLFSQDHCAGHAVYWSAKYDSAPIRFGTFGEFYFPMELDGKKLETTLATSRPMTVLHTDATRKLYNFDSHSPDIETETDAEGRTTAHYRAMKLSGEGIEIINARISLVDPAPNASCYLSSRSGAATYEGCFGIHPLALGQNVIGKLHLYVATKEKMLYFTPANTSE